LAFSGCGDKKLLARILQLQLQFSEDMEDGGKIETKEKRGKSVHWSSSLLHIRIIPKYSINHHEPLRKRGTIVVGHKTKLDYSQVPRWAKF